MGGKFGGQILEDILEERKKYSANSAQFERYTNLYESGVKFRQTTLGSGQTIEERSEELAKLDALASTGMRVNEDGEIEFDMGQTTAYITSLTKKVSTGGISRANLEKVQLLTHELGTSTDEEIKNKRSTLASLKKLGTEAARFSSVQDAIDQGTLIQGSTLGDTEVTSGELGIMKKLDEI